MFNQYNNLVDKYSKELEEYKVKPTKASSKRLREYILQMQKLSVGAKKDLISLDKGE